MRSPGSILPWGSGFLILLALWCSQGCGRSSSLLRPGVREDGTVLLPNGWMLSPAGRHLPTGELPLNMVVTADERFVLTLNNGTRRHDISVVDARSWQVIQTVPLRKSWLGITLARNDRELLVSGANDNRVFVFSLDQGEVTLKDSIVIAPPLPRQKVWVAGLDVDRTGRYIVTVGKENDSLYVIDYLSGNIVARLHLAATPYTCLASRAHDTVYVSLWGGGSVQILDLRTLTLRGKVSVGEHPCDMAESPDGTRLFVANANLNTVSVIDVARGRVTETLTTALFPDTPPGSTPNALAIDSAGIWLYAANADNNYLAVFDISEPGRSRSLGFVPTGWYPTCVRVLDRSGNLAVTSGKGLGSAPNPGGPNPEKPSTTEQYIGSMFQGSLSILPRPDLRQLEKYTSTVYACSPYARTRATKPQRDPGNPIPADTGGSSPIKYVFYVIKENRTYDQVFGDIPEGNGDPRLCLFPDSVTPNHHALARQFVLLDNFYVDAEVSADGHNWSMAAYATDYIEKTWPTMYGGRGGEYDYEGGRPIAYPSGGYLWDNCKRNGISFRSYGEFTREGGWPDGATEAAIEGLTGHVAPRYRGWDMDYSDVQRARDWQREFDEYDRSGGLPRFQIIKLPNDHTEGTRRGKPTPRAYVAQNDLALGMIVERISRSRYWKESAIFVIEDDAQNGPDHVDAHRTIALVISPYTNHGSRDSEMYSTSSMIRTMELILGLPPMSQFDAAATPMHRAFSSVCDTTPYVCRPSRVNLGERNIAGAYGQEESERMNFRQADAIPDVELSEIVWRSVKGAQSPMPSPVRSAFVRIWEEDE